MEKDWICELKLPILDIEERQGSTDYIDFITLDEMKQAAYKGVDMFKRNFTCIKFRIEFYNTRPGYLTSWYNYIFGETSVYKDERFQTFFQRYTGSFTYVGCGHGGPHLIETVGGMNDKQIQFIKDIITKGSVYLNSGEMCDLRISHFKEVPLYTHCVVSLSK